MGTLGLIPCAEAVNLREGLSYKHGGLTVPKRPTGRTFTPGTAAGLVPNTTKAQTDGPWVQIPGQAQDRAVDTSTVANPGQNPRIFGGM